MTTFQSIVYAIFHGMSQFLPLGTKAQHTFIPFLLNWEPAPEALMGALSIGTFLSLFIYFRHDWASLISSFLQMIIYRRKPMTLDERLPLFLILTTLPLTLCSYYLSINPAPEPTPSLKLTALLYVGFGLILLFCDYWGRKIKGTFDWNGKDSLIAGLAQLISLLPGGDPMTGLLAAAFFMNYRREAAAKYTFFASAPLLLGQTLHHLKTIDFGAAMPETDLSWLSFGVASCVACLAGLLAIGGFMRHVQQKGMGHYVAYRIFIATVTCVYFYFKG